MDIEPRQQPPADCLAGSAFEEHIIRYNHCCATVDLQQRGNMLNKIELLVAGCSPEIVTLITQRGLVCFALSIVTMVTMLFLPKGGLVSTISKR